MRKTILIAAAFAVLSGGPAFAFVPAEACIRHDDINNWHSLDDKHLVIDDYHHKKVLLTMIGTCSNFKFSDAIEIRGVGESRLDCISPGDEVQTRGIGSGPIHGRCAVTKVEPYTGQTFGKAAEHHDDNAGGSR
ncbi:MAG TPA: DUF6491 family protein [Rhizomicrobium sp.]|jgi:hypothetical protein|nr:DUF6491 family protein [Rhizomicrobium sp.]